MGATEWWGEPGESWQTGSDSKRDRMDAYVDWLVTPKELRSPKTKKELAEALGVDASTLRRYEKESFVQREVVRRGRGLAKVEHVSDVLDALYRRAMGDAEKASEMNSAAKIWLDWIDRETRETDEADLTQMSDEDLVAKIEELLGAMNKRA